MTFVFVTKCGGPSHTFTFFYSWHRTVIQELLAGELSNKKWAGVGAMWIVGGLRPLVAYFCHALENLGVLVPPAPTGRNCVVLLCTPRHGSFKLFSVCINSTFHVRWKTWSGLVRAKLNARDIPNVKWSVGTPVAATLTFPKRLYFMIVEDTFRTRILSPSGRESVSSSGVLLRFAGINMDGCASRHTKVQLIYIYIHYIQGNQSTYRKYY